MTSFISNTVCSLLVRFPCILQQAYIHDEDTLFFLGRDESHFYKGFMDEVCILKLLYKNLYLKLSVF